MRLAGLFAVALALLVVPTAGSAGITFSYSITSGTAGDNGWYRSAVTVSIVVTGATDTTCPSVKTFRADSDPPLDCTATDGNGTIPFHLDFKIDTDAPNVTGSQPESSSGRERLVQPARVAHVHGLGRDLGDRILHDRLVQRPRFSFGIRLGDV